MSSTSQVTTFVDLYTDLMQRVRVTTTTPATIEQAKRYINIALQDIHLGFDYKLPWCERQSYLRTKAPYITGTLTATKGSIDFTGSSTLWNTNNSFAEKNIRTQGKIIVAGYPDIYKVNAVTSDTALSVYTAFINTTVTGSSYTYFEDEYNLASSFLRPIDYRMFSPHMNIVFISRPDFRRRYPIINVSGRPRVACLIDTDTSGTSSIPTRRVVFYPYPDQVYNIPYTYISSTLATTSAGSPLISMASDTDEPLMPIRYRHAIVYHALQNWYRDRKDDARSESAKAAYEDIMMRIVGDHDIATHVTTRLLPSGGGYHRYASAPYGNRSGRKTYDLNNEWDSFRR